MDGVSHIVVSLVAIGMGIAFYSADRHSRTSLALAVAFVAIGVSIYLNVVILVRYASAPSWSGWLALPESLAILSVLEWILRVRRMLPVADGMDTRGGDAVLRFGQLCGLFYGLMSVLWPQLRIEAFERAPDQWAATGTVAFWLFMAPILVATLTGVAGVALLLNRRPDRVEAIRVVSMAVSSPFFIAGFVLPLDWAAIAAALGEVIFFVGAVHYHVSQGHRGQFMARFLSPAVARLVAERGLDYAMRESQRELTVVSCDLRGFTAFAAAHPSAEVLAVLRAYYDTVGREVARFGATIKDFAGDGVLMLVGAPLAVSDHARVGLDLAESIRMSGGDLMRRLSRPGYPLGLGVGVATGVVTVGVIGSPSRLEYTAVGSAVNLASRLCDQAADGQILVDDRAAQLDTADRLAACGRIALKGFAQPQPYFELPREPEAAFPAAAIAPAAYPLSPS